MLQMIKEYDYAHYVQDVEKLKCLVGEKQSAEEVTILDFFDSAQETVAKKLDTLANSTAYMYWCLSDEAQEILLFANSLSQRHKSSSKQVDVQICKCADGLAYVISIKCAQFYTED